MAYKPIKKDSLSEEAARRIVEMISSRELLPGDQIKEIDLSDTLQISRIPIREAFRILEREGIVDYFPRRGIRVKRFTEKEIRDLYDIRIMIDLYCVDRVFEKITPDDIAKLESFLEHMSDSAVAVVFNDSFHKKIISLSGNEKLEQTWKSIEKQVQLAMVTCTKEETLHLVSQKMHQDIIQALKDGDKDAYKKAITIHYEEACDRVVEYWNNREKE